MLSGEALSCIMLKFEIDNKMIDSNPIETRIASVYKDDNEVIIITMKDCGEVDEMDVLDLNLVIRQKANQQKALKLLILLSDFDLTKKAKEMAAKEDNLSQTKARAVVVSNRLKASVFNFMKQFSEKSYPQQFFKNQDEAYQWLLSLK